MLRHGILLLAAAAAAAFLAVTPASAYYHYVHFLTGKAPFVAVPEAFDLTALPNNTVTFFVTDTGLSQYGVNDSWGSVLSQVKQAAAAWNSIASSDLRVAFGGTESSSSTATTSGGDVIFEELTPGLLGMGTPVMSTAPAVQTGANGQFLPIQRGLVILTNNTDSGAGYGPGPSYLEEFYTTAVHEFGHALGLQHTWTASAMSQDVIRNTSRARPLDADDIAAISELYGKANWMANFGSISGRVTLGGGAVNLASVVAIPMVGPAVSALTNPDGTYTINGLPPNSYLLYVHPLPPDAVLASGTGLTLPVDANGSAVYPRSGYFQTIFYPGAIDPQQATTFTIAAGQSLTDQNFAVQARNGIPIYDVVTYCYLDSASRTYTYNYTHPELSIWLTPAFVSTAQSSLRVWAQANNGATPMPAQATLLGPGSGSAQTQLYSGYLVMDFNNNGSLSTGPRHLVMTFNTPAGPDIYVLPDAVNVVQRRPPSLAPVTPNSDGTVTINGAGLGVDSRIFFDGLQSAVVTPYTAIDDTNGSITVAPPDGVSGQNATVTVFNSDAQNSMLLQSGSPVIYAYPASNAPRLTGLSVTALPAGFNVDGTASTVDITAENTNFVDGQVTLGFGSSDIIVRRVWVLSPTHLVANLVVANNATIGSTPVTVISGFQVVSAPAAFQIQPANSSLPTMALPVVDAITYQAQLYPGRPASIFGSGLSVTPAGSQVSLNGTAVQVLYSASSQINFVIPANFPIGRATLVVNNGAVDLFPVFVQIDGPPPVVSASPVSGAPAMSAITSAGPGDTVTVLVTNADPTIVGALSRVQVTMSGVSMPVLSITQVSAAAADQPASSGVLQVQFVDTQSFGGSQVPVVVSIDGSASAPLTITGR